MRRALQLYRPVVVVPEPDFAHEFVTACSNPDCGGSCFICCCGYCRRCGLFEGALTTDCPGEDVYRTHADAVYAGGLDYRQGVWLLEDSPHSPAAHR